MDEPKWMVFINHYWVTLAFRHLTKLYRKHALPGAFFALNAHACRNELLMRIAHSFHLCQEIAKEYPVGDDAKGTLEEIRMLFEQGHNPDRSVLTFEDCGVRAFRDKILAHPLNSIKEILGKEKYQISLNWETVDRTLERIKEFADQVEQHNLVLGKWDFSTHKEGVSGLEESFTTVTLALEGAEKYEQLQRTVIRKGGKATVSYDWKNHDLVVEE